MSVVADLNTDNARIPWAGAAVGYGSPDQQRQLVATGDLVQQVIRMPLFNALPTFVLGLPFALYILAHLRRPSPVPTWTAALAGVTGTASFVIGPTWTAGSSTAPALVLWVVLQPLIWIWGSPPESPFGRCTDVHRPPPRLGEGL